MMSVEPEKMVMLGNCPDRTAVMVLRRETAWINVATSVQLAEHTDRCATRAKMADHGLKGGAVVAILVVSLNRDTTKWSV